MKKLITALLKAASLITSSVHAAGTLDDANNAHKKANYPQAIKIYKALALKGNAKAQVSLGGMYEYGHGVEQDYVEAVKWYKLAAAQGHAKAQVILGGMYENGRGVVKDQVEAVKWYKLAAAQGVASAQTNLGFMYNNGHGVAQDQVEAVKWYKLAAAQGVAIAQNNLGFMYNNGHGVEQDYVEAVKWYKLAAVQGYAGAQFNLGNMYYAALGVAQDQVEAVKWFKLAAAQGFAQAQTKLGVMDDGAWLKEWLNEEIMLNLTKNLHDGRVEESKDGEISQQDEIIAKLAILSESKNIKTCMMTIQPRNVNWSWDFSFSNEELESADKLVSALHDIRNGDFSVVLCNLTSKSFDDFGDPF